MGGSSRWPRRRSSRLIPRSTTSVSRPSAARRYVGMGRTDEFGLRTVIARVRPATRSGSQPPSTASRRSSPPLTPRPAPTSCARSPSDTSLGPPSCSQLLLEHTRAEPGPRGVPTAPSRATAFPADLLDALRSADLATLAPRSVLYVHLHEAALARCRLQWPEPRASARSPLSALCGLLGRTRLTVRPVRDLCSPGPLDRLRAPRVAQGADLPPHRRGLLALRHLHQPTRRLRPPDGVPTTPVRPSAARARPVPTTRARWVGDITAGRRTPATASRQCGDGRYVWLTPHGLGLPGRPPRHPSDRSRQGARDVRGATGRGPLLHVATCCAGSCYRLRGGSRSLSAVWSAAIAD